MRNNTDSEPVEAVPEMLAERLDESDHHDALMAAEEALERANRTAEGYPFDREAQEHLRTALRHLRQSRELYRAHHARTLIGDIEQREIDREEEP